MKKKLPKTNLERVCEKAFKEGYMVGCYDNKVNELNTTNLRKVLAAIRYQEDVKVFINRKPYIAQVDEVDGYIDFDIITLAEYESRFGKWED